MDLDLPLIGWKKKTSIFAPIYYVTLYEVFQLVVQLRGQ